MDYFVTGTDTDVGKTVACAWLVHHLKANYWKPVQSGSAVTRDADVIQKLTNCNPENILKSCYDLQAFLSPHQAAALEKQSISLNHIAETYQQFDFRNPTIIEGAGGLFVPLNQKDFIIDLIEKLDIPTILIARTGLGTINHTLLSLEALHHRQIQVTGIIAIGETNDKNLHDLENLGKTKIIAHIPILSPLCYESLSSIPPRIPLCS